MVSKGVVAENEFLLASMRRIGDLMEIRQEELLALLDHYCDASLPLLIYASVTTVGTQETGFRYKDTMGGSPLRELQLHPPF